MNKQNQNNYQGYYFTGTFDVFCHTLMKRLSSFRYRSEACHCAN